MAPKLKRKTQPLELLRKPMAQAVRVTLFEREVRERLSGPAVEILLGRAQVLAEGRRAATASCADVFFGTIMLTIDLERLAGDVREPCDAMAAERVAQMMGADARVMKRVRQLAEREAARLAGAKVQVHSADVRVRAEGTRVFVDVEIGE
ncbi:MAG TPA: hypothetical protein VII38_02020 [Polyangia bacterium]|jgi:hypothetical protein